MTRSASTRRQLERGRKSPNNLAFIQIRSLTFSLRPADNPIKNDAITESSRVPTPHSLAASTDPEMSVINPLPVRCRIQDIRDMLVDVRVQPSPETITIVNTPVANTLVPGGWRKGQKEGWSRGVIMGDHSNFPHQECRLEKSLSRKEGWANRNQIFDNQSAARAPSKPFQEEAKQLQPKDSRTSPQHHQFVTS